MYSNINLKHICVYGSSVSLYVRPARKTRKSGNYSELLEQRLKGIRVSNFGCTSGQLKELLVDFDSNVIRMSPDIVVFNYGINECSPRFLPPKIFTLIHGRNLSNGAWTIRLKAVFNVLLNRKFGPIILRIKGNSGWCSPERFRFYCDIFRSSVIKESKSKIIALTIPKPNNRIQSLLPGILERVHAFNEVIRNVFNHANHPDCHIIDLNKLWDGNEDELIPDGIHFSEKGHLEVAQILSKLCEELSNG